MSSVAEPGDMRPSSRGWQQAEKDLQEPQGQISGAAIIFSVASEEEGGNLFNELRFGKRFGDKIGNSGLSRQLRL